MGTCKTQEEQATLGVSPPLRGVAVALAHLISEIDTVVGSEPDASRRADLMAEAGRMLDACMERFNANKELVDQEAIRLESK